MDKSPNQFALDRLANRHVLSVTPYKTGRPSSIGIDASLNSLIPLASNENPAGPSPLALQALAAVLPEIHRYPDDGGYRLKEALAEKHDLGSDNIILGHGATDVLEIVVRAFLSADDEVVSAHPSFPWFQILGQLSGARNVVVPLRNYRHDLEAMAAATTPRTKLVFIANPNNPTGTTVGPRQMQSFFERVPEQVVVVIDEAYVEYITGEKLDSLQYLSKGPVVVVRTFSKIGGLAGLRVGYGMADAGVIQLLERVRQPFNTTALAQIAALASLYDRRHILKSRKLVIQGKAFLYGEFARLGIDYVPTQANFVFVDFNSSVEPIVDALLTRGFLIRPVLPTCARVTIGSPEQNTALVEALEAVLSGGDARRKRGDYGKRKTRVHRLYPPRRRAGARRLLQT